VQVLVLDGAMASSVAITVDVLDTANRICRTAGHPPAFSLVQTGSGATGSHPNQRPEDAARPDLIVVPGLGMTTEREVTERLARPDAAQARQALRAAADDGTALASSCSGVFLLAAAGVLRSRRATTSWWLAPLFRRLFPEVLLEPDELVVADPPVTTAGAALAQIDLMLTLVAAWGGGELADRCAQYLVVDRRRSQSPYLALADVAATDRDVARARQWALANLNDALSVNDLAAAVHLSPRTFARRVREATGLSPIRFLRRLRVDKAVGLLRTTTLTVDAVARAVGYADPTTLRRAMREELGHGPRAARHGQRPPPSA